MLAARGHERTVFFAENSGHPLHLWSTFLMLWSRRLSWMMESRITEIEDEIVTANERRVLRVSDL